LLLLLTSIGSPPENQSTDITSASLIVLSWRLFML
jgi:hypothetical protein